MAASDSKILNALDVLDFDEPMKMPLEKSFIDAGNLLIMASEIPENETIEISTTRLTQEFVDKFFTLPTHQTDIGMIFDLPKPKTKIPREKHIPEAKPLTKWQKFANEKGIKNKKRERKVYDSVSETWKPLYGKNSIKHSQEDREWVIEHDSDSMKEGEDPFLLKRKKRKEQIEKQGKRELANKRAAVIEEAKKMVGKNTASLVVGRSSESARDISKERLMKTLQHLQRSTRSMGAFDKKSKDEPKNNRINKANLPSDKEQEKTIIRRVLRGATRKYDEKRGQVVMEKLVNQEIQKEKQRTKKEKDLKLKLKEQKSFKKFAPRTKKK